MADKDTAMSIAVLCGGMDLIEADTALDAARRTLWMQKFGGEPISELFPEIEVDGIVRAITEKLNGLTVLDAQAILFDARIALWMQVFVSVPGSRFLSQIEATITAKNDNEKSH